MGRSGGGGGGGHGGGFSGGHSGGFSGGGRSSGSFSGGFGSGRSGGGRSGGGRSYGGSSHHSGPVFGGGYRGPVFINTRRYYGAPPTPPGGGPRRGRQNSGCGTFLAVIVILVVFVAVLFPLFSFAGGGAGGSAGIARSTVAREPLPAGAVNETAYYTDEPGWISNSGELTDGMKRFYKQTGVQPYLYIAETVDGSRRPSSSAIQAYAETLYEQLFTDEAHFLLVFCDNGDGGYMCGYSVGAQAKTIMDDEALGILADYLDRYYSSDMEDEEFFSRTFEKTGERIMTVTKSPWPAVLTTVVVVAAVVVVVALLYKWWKHAKEQKNLEDQRTQDILNTPLEKFGDTEVEDLAKKYEDGTKEE